MAKSPASTRCQPGDIAIFTSGRNVGKLCLIERKCAPVETIDGSIFEKTPNGHVAWVVSSLGGPLLSRYLSGTVDPKPRMVAAFDENILRPIRKPRGADQSLRWTATRTKKPQGETA